ncbi:MAG TPA: S9 family peptidase [Cyclobacteriaceae bacterium]|nr:S9 family peptidase [Cyclobacteriaceae bacterium]
MLKYLILAIVIVCQPFFVHAQNQMTPELLWSLGRVSGMGISMDGRNVIYKVSTPNLEENSIPSKTYSILISGGQPQEINSTENILPDKLISPDGQYRLSIADVKIVNTTGKEFYPDLDKSNARVYQSLNYRHWDTWEDGAYSHLFLQKVSTEGEPSGKDIMINEPYDCPLKPSGGNEDFTWSPDSRKIVYTSKKKFGTNYAISTNTDLYEYNITSETTVNLTEGMTGYDTHPLFSSRGILAWLSMKSDGNEADKNDVVVDNGADKINLTQHWDGTVMDFQWSNDGRKIFFTAATDGTIQLFEVDYPGLTKKVPIVNQITQGDFDITSFVGQVDNMIVVTRTDMNHAAEIYTVDLVTGAMKQLTFTNSDAYNRIYLSKFQRKYVTTSDGKKMLVWIILPPGFNSTKKYPALLYCQGGPQTPLSQFYSFRWNLQLMAANGYVVVAPNRRGMPGHGVAWNEQISKDHGGQAIQDYLSAIDEVSKEPYVDKERIGCVGASYGGYSVFYLEGIHNNRFKTFIAHDGIFNTKSMYGTTEELWFVNWEYGGPYWEKDDTVEQSYTTFDPSSMVDKWNTPILIIHGGKDFRVNEGQAFEAFQAAQLRGIKSKLLYFPDENHWVLSPQNGLVWQREFFGWLAETMK